MAARPPACCWSSKEPNQHRQDALVERVLADFLIAQRYAGEARIFAHAATDPEAHAELAALERELGPLERETWPE